ncbi:MAG: recombinase family protein [Proteobacteria bacterium]|nr:recombinase family protein [Pseudomonadota bacterium]
MKVAIFARVSTMHQTTENQLLELYEVCERNDWSVVEEYNETVSGTKGVNERKEPFAEGVVAIAIAALCSLKYFTNNNEN